jgi:nucleotide-binding universal stress UspA family protein
MFRNILVPLDGSALSEKALPLAMHIARRARATIRLTCVLPPFADGLPPSSHSRREEETALDLAAWRVRRAVANDIGDVANDVTVLTSVLEGPVAPTLAEHAVSVGADLIVMTTHGRGALSRFWLGSVTDELIRRSAVPMLVVRPADSTPANSELGRAVPIRRIIVPLDGSVTAEAALGPAAALAHLFGVTVELFNAVPSLQAVVVAGNVLTQPVVNTAFLDEMIRQANEMMNDTAARLVADGLEVATSVVVAEEQIAKTILNQTRTGDMIALATHARGPATRWLLGSVADKLIRGADVPVLVVRPTGDNPTS